MPTPPKAKNSSTHRICKPSDSVRSTQDTPLPHQPMQHASLRIVSDVRKWYNVTSLSQRVPIFGDFRVHPPLRKTLGTRASCLLSRRCGLQAASDVSKPWRGKVYPDTIGSRTMACIATGCAGVLACYQGSAVSRPHPQRKGTPSGTQAVLYGKRFTDFRISFLNNRIFFRIGLDLG